MSAPAAALGAPLATAAETETQRKIGEFLVRAAEARGLSPLAAVEGAVVDRVALLAGVRAHVARELPPDVMRHQGELMLGLGLVPPGFDYEEGTFRLLESQLAGFYEYRDKKMYVASDLDGPSTDQALAHELVHALQDQHFGLASRISYQPEANDRETAFQSLAEGDATSAMLDVVDSSHRAVLIPDDQLVASIEASNGPSRDGAIPPVIMASLVAPYIDGVLFVQALRRRGMSRGNDPTGWSEVDLAWRAPPETTEQLLHVERYDAREPAEKVARIAPPSETGWSTVYEDVFGEQGLRITAEQWMPRKVAAAVAQGWGGDRLALFRRVPRGSSPGEPPATSGGVVSPADYAVAWHIRFDAGRPDVEGEARQAFKALADALHMRPIGNPNTVCADRGSLGPIAVARAGRDLALTAGPYEHNKAEVRSASSCPQTARWAADILRRRKP